MPDRELRINDTGPDVIEAQHLLNRNGAILEPDGAFGGGTAAAVREFQNSRGLPPSATIDAATWGALRELAEPSPDIPTRAVAFIAREEVSSRRFYDTRCAQPTWPGGDSGVTIGVGYDLGYQSEFATDWAGMLTAAQIAALLPWLGVKGAEAKPGPAQLMGVTIPWSAAWTAFIRRTLPNQIKLTRATFVGPGSIPPLCLGMLVSLVYNRGTSMTDSTANPGNRREMRDIRDAIAAGHLAAVPAALRAMKRLWSPDSGLVARREREARMFEEGLG